MNKKHKIRYYVGIDEVGRGPLAGPVSVGVFCIPVDNLSYIDTATDSKQTTLKARDDFYKTMLSLRRDGICSFTVVHKTAKQIDMLGISRCIKDAIATGLAQLSVDPISTQIFLDGLLYAPAEYIHQRTIIKGDSIEKTIGAASIVAKVTRDRYMVRMSKTYPDYGFEAHKGYGTETHRKAIKRSGICPLHRAKWVRNILG